MRDRIGRADEHRQRGAAIGGAIDQLAEAVLEPDVGLVDLVDTVLGMKLHRHTDLQAVVQLRLPQEIDIA